MDINIPCKADAVVIAAARVDEHGSWVVAYKRNGEYITHDYSETSDSCYNGHYFHPRDYEGNELLAESRMMHDFVRRLSIVTPSE